MTSARVPGSRLVLTLAGLLLATACLAVHTQSARAAGCSGTLTQPFLPWLDPGKYVLAPNGALEGTTGWKLSGGAKLVSGNETYRVHSSKDTRSLSLPSGSSATTGPMCVGVLYPTLRFFTANSGALTSTLKVEMLTKSPLGTTLALPIGALVGTSSWQPTLPLLYLGNVTAAPLLSNGTTSVQFRFTPLGSSSGWRIDDVYVDPYKGR